MKHYKLFFGFALMLVLIGCSNSNTVVFDLIGTKSTININSKFIRIDKQGIEAACIRANMDTGYMLDKLDAMEAQDKHIDLFVDTTELFHLMFVLDVTKTPLSEKTASYMTTQFVSEVFSKAKADPSFDLVEWSDDYSLHGGIATYNFDTHYYFTESELNMYHSLRIQTTRQRTYMILEYSLDGAVQSVIEFV